MNLEPFHRQRDLLTPDQLVGLDVEVIGAGALGGAILVCLCKMGFGIANRMAVWDFDRCEAHNLPTQWFRPSHVALNQPKVEALAEMVEWVTGVEVEPIEARFTGSEARPVGPIVVLAVDTLAERRAIWKQLRGRDDVHLLVDARMGAEILDLHALDLDCDSTDAYAETLDDAGEPYEEPCTRRSVLYTTLGAAAFVGSILRAYACEEPFPRHLAFDFRNYLITTTDAPETRLPVK
jgi:molybdopterin/thiamine biosynthesis adenylyltransferase